MIISRNRKVIAQNNRSVNTNSDVRIFYLNSYKSIYFSKTCKGMLVNLTFALQHIKLRNKVSVIHENLSAFAATLTCNIELGIYIGHGNLQSM